LAYQALYRKYRPMLFEDVVGQDVIIKTLKNSIKESKISHAYLFCGPRGTGKTSVAKLIAKMINCESPSMGNPCGNCNFCKQIVNKETQDIIEIDAASNNGVDEIREIKNKVGFMPGMGKFKIYIIDEVHMLSTGAFNALLKTLEEPPAHVIFILATTEPYKLPLTIISRCQRFDFKKIPIDFIKQRISHVVKIEKVDIEDAAIDEIARISDGGLRDALGILDQLTAFCNDKIMISDVHDITGTVSKEEMMCFLEKNFNNEIEDTFKQLDKFNSNGKDLIKFSEELIMLLRDILIIKNVPNYFCDDCDMEKLYKKNKDMAKEEKIYDWIIELNNTINNMKNSNHPKILLETMILKLQNSSFSSVENSEMPEELPKVKEITCIDDNVLTTENNNNDDIKKDLRQEKNVEIIKNVRVNNSLSNADKKILDIIKKNWLKISSYSVDPYFGPIAGILLDCEIKVAGSKYLVITYKYDSMVERVNSSLGMIEKLLEKVFENNYKIIALIDNEWEIIRKEYVSKMKLGYKYEMLDEPSFQEDNSNNNISSEDDLIKSAIDVFGDKIVVIK
jgi:DNA polymerase III subunit gamma/tau